MNFYDQSREDKIPAADLFLFDVFTPRLNCKEKNGLPAAATDAHFKEAIENNKELFVDPEKCMYVVYVVIVVER